MSTYSIGQAPTNADKLEDLTSVLLGLPDNTQKLITPKNVRNAIYTTWENITFKLTNIATSAISYIGIDNVDIKNKILIGKKEKTSGQNVMSGELLNSDVDVFFFNTKSSTQSSDTKIAILAGTGSYWRGSSLSSPYLSSSVINNEYVNFNIVNNSYGMTGSTAYGGDINILSEKGYVSLNNLLMPKITDNVQNKDGYVLKFRWSNGQPFAVWGTVSASGGQTVSSETFTDPNPVTTALGGIKVGETFSNVPVTTMLRKLIYQYIGPTIQISLSNPILEIGDSASFGILKLNYTITRTSTQSITNLTFNPAIIGAPSTSSIPQGVTAGSKSVVTYDVLSPNSWRIVPFTSSIADGVSSSTSSTSLLYTLPWYYGTATVSTTASTINSILGTNSSTKGKLIPLLTNPATQSIVSNNKTLNITTNGLSQSQGYVYFGYPNDFVDLVDIKDNNGNSVFTSFRKFAISSVQSPQLRWGSRTYSFYILTGSTSSSIPQLTTINQPQSPFQFIFSTQ
jgi:hypothetical protein